MYVSAQGPDICAGLCLIEDLPSAEDFIGSRSKKYIDK